MHLIKKRNYLFMSKTQVALYASKIYLLQERNLTEFSNEYKQIRLLLDDLQDKLNKILDQNAHKKILVRLEQIEFILANYSHNEIVILQDQRKNEISNLCFILKSLKNTIK